MGKYTERKKRQIIIMIGTEEKQKEILKNLHQLRRSVNNITITQDLTVQQREELHELNIRQRKFRQVARISSASTSTGGASASTSTSDRDSASTSNRELEIIQSFYILIVS